MQKLTVISNGIKKREEKITNSIKEFQATGEFEKVREYNIVEADLELSEVGEHIDVAMENVANELVKYYKKNGAKNIVVKNCWSTSDKVYNGLRNKTYYAGWIEIEFEKEIKNLDRVANNLDKKIEELVKAENKKMEETTRMLSVEDMIIDHIEEMEREFPNREDVAEIVTNAIMDCSGDWKKLHNADKFDYLYDILAGENKEVVKFSPELTAIPTRKSKSAEMIKDVAVVGDKILDYGCGTGRNMEFMNGKEGLVIHGTDIPEQLEKERKRHDRLREFGMVIDASGLIKDEVYDYVLNSHVLNVIADDKVKKFVLSDMFKKLKKGGKAYIEVRTKSDVEGAKTKEKYGDGWKIRKGSNFTYQEAISKEKMMNMLNEIGFKIQEYIFSSDRHIVVASK